jgi:outer membrane protein OmpA-like peptidoglycan-associated protein
MKHIIRSGTGALVAGMIAAGCSTTPPASDVAAADSAINSAGEAISHASADPQVGKYAADELERANDSLGKAKAAWNNKHDLQATTHLAYIAQQRAATAQEFANGRAAEQAVMVAAAERDHAVSVAAAERRARPAPGTETPGLAGFAFGAAKLPPKAKAMIDELAANLQNNPGSKVEIEGHTDNVGNPEYNRTLAMERAEAVRAALVRRGIDPSRITVRSHGAENPIASNDTSTGRRENRRAGVIIADTGSPAMGSSQGSAGATSSGEGEQKGLDEQKGQSGQSGQNGEDDRRRQ